MSTVAHLLTALVVLRYESVRSPATAGCLAVVVKELRVSSKILVVMCIGTLSFVMFLVEGAPLCLVVEHEEVWVLLH